MGESRSRSRSRSAWVNPCLIVFSRAEQKQARAEEQVKAEAKQALCRERMSMWLEDPVQQRFDKEDHERDVEWLRENCDWHF